MNYPVWQLPFPGGLLIAVVAVAHVFVSHFAIGGGAFLVLSERRARRSNDTALLAYVRRHSRFFALLTLVFGAVSGVGIWFTIGLVSPEATSALIHIFVWAWAIEWVFFFVEIAAAIIYAKSWDKLSAADHQRIGWIYVVASWLSLAVINGIITFMLTPGGWLRSHRVLDGFFNPTYLPSLLLRTAICILLAGAFGLVTVRGEAGEVRRRIVRWASLWVVTGTVLLPPLAAWYYARIPNFSKLYLSGMLVSSQHVVRGGIAFAALALLIALVCGVWRPQLMRAPVIVILLAMGLGVIGSVEYLREFVRKPWAINGYIYGNDVRATSVDRLREKGTLTEVRFSVSEQAQSIEHGRQLFQAQCARCHSLDGYRSLRQRVRGWDAEFASDMLAHIEVTRGAMPPFAGDERDRAALGRFLASLNPSPAIAKDPEQAGRQVFATRCGSCHTVSGRFRPLSNALAGAGAEQIEGLLPVLDAMSPNMPRFSAPPEQAQALAGYLSRSLAAKEAR